MGMSQHALTQVMSRARQELPGAWLPVIGAEAHQAAGQYHDGFSPVERQNNQIGVWRSYLDTWGGAVASNLSDGQIKIQARAYAGEADDLDIGLLTRRGPWGEYARLLDFCATRDVAAPPVKLLLSGMGARVRCEYWWRRALRKMVARKSELGHMTMGLVSAPNHQPYASNQAVYRRLDQNERNRQALENITLENDEGYRRTLAELAETSVSNRAIRRGELMTRIRGCEELADECGHVGLFVTGTLPSRFHSTKRNGRRNPKYQAGLTPRDGQDWLCDKWQKTRAKLQRLGVVMYGFRVAEPHHDGCVHWHMLIWFGDRVKLPRVMRHGPVQPAIDTFQRVMRDYWLSDDGDSKAAQEYRTNFKRMESGGAAGYIAKYISKNIDDHGIDSHIDDYAVSAIGPDLLGDIEIKPCQRVEAWASHWGIRQFQPLGQPPVTVWRELRRVTEKNARAAGKGGIIHKAWMACQKSAVDNASWSRYCKAQGGLMRGRNCQIKMRHDRREVTGLYGTDMQNVPVGVALNCKGSRTVWSERRLWRAVDVSAPVPALECALDKRSASARTRVNNCTDVPVLGGQSWVIPKDKSGSWSGGTPVPDGFDVNDGNFEGREGNPNQKSTFHEQTIHYRSESALDRH